MRVLLEGIHEHQRRAEDTRFVRAYRPTPSENGWRSGLCGVDCRVQDRRPRFCLIRGKTRQAIVIGTGKAMEKGGGVLDKWMREHARAPEGN